MKNLHETLLSLQDKSYKEFHTKLMPGTDPDRIIGIRTPELRKFTKEFAKNNDIYAFMDDLPHFYYEENNMHGFLISSMKDIDECIERLDRFLPYVDNWATCDCISPVSFRKDHDKAYRAARRWISSSHTYTIRFGIGVLMKYFLDDYFQEEHLQIVSEIQSDEYYVNMMSAWYFATALAKQYDSAVVYLQNEKLPLWVHNKTIQKAVESYRITPEQKAYLKSLRRTS